MNDNKKVIKNYIQNLNTCFQTNSATEHSYRPFLQELLKDLYKDITVINEPTRQECGAPDFMIKNQNSTIGYIEVKDVDKDLDNSNYTEQFDRYKKALNNLVISNFLEFRFYRNGSEINNCQIAKIVEDKIIINEREFETFLLLFDDFIKYQCQNITSAEKLAEMMAQKAKLINFTLNTILNEQDEEDDLIIQYNFLKRNLIADMTLKDFADIYSQTMVYGAFIGRYYDDTLEDFSIEEMLNNIPNSNPFLKGLFKTILDNQDNKIQWAIEDLIDFFKNTNVNELFNDYLKQNKDPIVHFFELFLTKYDKETRKKRGCWYTPSEVVKFIVNSVDIILKQDFNVVKGLADNTNIEQKELDKVVNGQNKYKTIKYSKVQILDPSTGTGTFLVEICRKIYESFKNDRGMWDNYVKEHLISKLNGFEILMTSYIIAHLKLDLFLKNETNYENQDRFKIFLTNSLEEGDRERTEMTLFTKYLTVEIADANKVKTKTPIMIVIGNPPYAVSSQNKNDYIEELIKVYKQNLNERKINLDDDYIKFIRYGESYIEKNKKGILAYITNNSFLDGPTHRTMRKHLLTTFDKIYIVNLHGDRRRDDLTEDQNVFDISQGVSINIFVKTSDSQQLADVYYYDLQGSRKNKFQFLLENDINSIEWKKLEYQEPYYFFTEKVFSNKEEYEMGFKIEELIVKKGSGVSTDRDSLFYDTNKEILENRIKKLLSGDYDNNFKEKYNVNNSSSFKLLERINRKNFNDKFIIDSQYRILDNQKIYYDHSIISRPNYDVMQYFIGKYNYGFVFMRASKDNNFYFITNKIIDRNFLGNGQSYLFPLYLYNSQDNTTEQSMDGITQIRNTNFNKEITKEIAIKLDLEYKQRDNLDKENATEEYFDELNLFDYIYAVLWNENYREKYKEFLKIEFPRVPYPTDKELFFWLVNLGKQLRKIHLLENKKLDENPLNIGYPVVGNDTIEKVEYRDNKLYINSSQHFTNIPKQVFDFVVGNKSPLQSWLKYRKNIKLNNDDINYFKKISNAIYMTMGVLKELNKIDLG